MPENREVLPSHTDARFVALTVDEIKGLRMALRFGVPDPEPDLIASARHKLEDAQASIAPRPDEVEPLSQDVFISERRGDDRG